MNDNEIREYFANINKNFYGTVIDIEADDSESTFFLTTLYNLKEHLVQKINKEGLTNTQKLDLFFHKCFKLFDFTSFMERITIDEDVFWIDCIFEACLYTAICMFIHNSKRIKGMRLREMVYEHSPRNYKENSQIYNYGNGLSEEEATFRKMRNRILSARKVNESREKWQAISKDSEHEWSFYYILESLDNKMQDTYKRLGNLNNDIDKVLESDRDEDFENKLHAAYDKFISKLKKIKYENYLDLQKEIINHLCKDKEYYGINIYRYEKELMLYKLTSETNALLKYNDEEEKRAFLWKTFIFKDIHFPKVYNNFMLFTPSKALELANWFSYVKNVFVEVSCLMLDILIEKGYFGENWEDLLISTLNEKAESTFYNPDIIDYTNSPELQQAFEDILSYPVKVIMDVSSRNHF